MVCRSNVPLRKLIITNVIYKDKRSVPLKWNKRLKQLNSHLLQVVYCTMTMVDQQQNKFCASEYVDVPVRTVTKFMCNSSIINELVVVNDYLFCCSSRSFHLWGTHLIAKTVNENLIDQIETDFFEINEIVGKLRIRTTVCIKTKHTAAYCIHLSSTDLVVDSSTRGTVISKCFCDRCFWIWGNFNRRQ